MNIKTKVALNTLMQIIEKIIVYGIGFISVSLIAHHFQLLGYGNYSIANNYVNFFALFADWGIGLIVSRDLIKKEGIAREVFLANSMSFRLCISCIIYGIALILVPFTHYSHDVIIGIMILIASQFIISFGQIFTSISQIYLNTVGITVGELLGRIVSVLLVIGIIVFNLSLTFTFIASLIANIVLITTTYFFIRKYVKLSFQIDLRVWKELLLLSIPIGIAGILATVYFKIDSVLLSFMKSPIEVGMYSLPYKLLEILLVIPGIFMGLIMPQLSKNFFEKNKEKLTYIVNKALEFMVILAIPTVIGIICTANQIIPLIGGKSFKAYIPITFMHFHIQATPALSLQILSIAVGISFIGNIFGYLLIAINGQNQSVWRNLCIAIFNIVANILVIPTFTFIGTSITTALSELLSFMLTYIICMQLYPMHIHVQKLPHVLFSSCIMAGVLILFHAMPVIPLVLIGSITYLGCMYLVHGIEKQELIDMLKIRNG